MIHRMHRYLNVVLAAGLLGSVASISPASAGMIGTDEVAVDSQASNDRERVKALVARPEVAKQLQALGVPPEKAQARVDAMTDSEVRTLANRLDALPAAGNFSDFQWVMIIIGIVIIALLV
ncbi:MAG: PA2779 family protein [Betaproteobacteria bacterium]|nr:PA2779 family protein [Betaproteobacteria bacterium]